MSEYLQFKQKIQQRLDILGKTIQELEHYHLVEATAVSRWRQHLAQVHNSLQEQLLRIAVIGSVKSGKSTFINALLGVDLLKRGAGIITAFITRVRTNEQIGGWVELKSWSQVLAELNEAIRLLPIFQEEMLENDSLDVRRSEDRRRLAKLLKTMQEELQRGSGQVDPNFVLLNAYLEGYNRLQNSVGESISRLDFDEQSLEHHQRYVGQEAQAVYLRDMELHYPVPWLGNGLEIADCQGSDSPNPLHFALLQDYLLRSHFILYVISSRTGLREADFKLIDFLKTLRMFPQTFFILNVDLDAHPHLEDLQQLISRVHTELSWIVPNPQLFTFSALYQLLRQKGSDATERESRLLDMWRMVPDLVNRTESGFREFQQDLSRRVANQRVRVLMASGLSRLTMVAGTIADTTKARKKFLTHDVGALKATAKGLKAKQKTLSATYATLKNAISGFKDTLKKELEDAVNRFFDLTYGPIIVETLDVVEKYPIDPRYLEQLSDSRQVLRQLYYFYIEFRQALSRYLVEKVNLRIIEFAKDQEEFLKTRMQQSSASFWALFATALEDYRQELAKLQVDLRPVESLQNTEWILWHETAPPSFTGFVEQEALSRGMLLMKFGLGRLSRFFTSLKGRVGKLRKSQTKEEESQSLQEAVSLVKSETKSELMFNFRDYRQNFKYKYLFRILEEGCTRLREEFEARTEMAQLDFANLLKQSQMEEEKRLAMVEVLDQVSRISATMVQEVDGLRCAVSLESPPEANLC